MSAEELDEIPIMDDWRLFPAAVMTWACTWWAVSRDWGWAHSCILASLAVTAAASARSLLLRRRIEGRHLRIPGGSIRAALIALAAAGCLALAVGGSARAAYRAGEANEAAEAGALVTLLIRAENDPRTSTSPSGVAREHVNARILGVGAHRAPSPPLRLMLRAPGGTELRRGDLLEVRGVIDPSFPGALPFVGSMTATPVLVGRPGGIVGWTGEFRRAFEEAASGLDDQGRALVPGMAIGDDRAMSEELEEAFRASSLSHLTAVSGSHMAIVIGFVPLLVPGGTRPRVAASSAVLVLLVLVVGPSPAVMRAAVTSGAALIGRLLSRGGQGLSALSLTVLLILLVDPWSARDFGFALSVASTFGVVVPAAAGRRRARRSRHEGSSDPGVALRLAERLVDLVRVPAWCQIMTTPLLLLLDPRIPLYSVAANVLAAPAVAPATLISLSAAILAPASPWMGERLARIASFFTGWIAEVALGVASLPGARMEPATPAGALLVLGIGAGALLILGRSLVPGPSRARARNARGTCHT